MTFLEVLNGMLTSPADWQDLSHTALSSRYIHNPYDRAAVALCLHSSFVTQLRMNDIETQLQDLKTAKSVKATTIVQDQYQLSVNATSLPDDQIVIVLPSPFRSVNIRSAVRYVVSKRSAKTKTRSVVVEMNSALIHCIRQAICPNDTRKFYYGNKRLPDDSFTEFDSSVATSIAAGLVSFVSLNPNAITDGYTAPVPDYDQLRGIALSLLTDVLGDGPNRRLRPRYQFMENRDYISHINTDSLNLQRVQDMEMRSFGQFSLQIPSPNLSVFTNPIPSPSPPLSIDSGIIPSQHNIINTKCEAVYTNL